MKIFITYCILTVDIEKQKSYVISTDSKKILLPTMEIAKPKFFHNEMRYNIKKMFADGEIRFLEEILTSKLEFQNQFAMEYLSSNKEYDFDIDRDCVFLCCSLIEKKIPQTYSWKLFSLEQEKDKENNPVFYILDLAAQNV
jgi:hypothetical protein